MLTARLAGLLEKMCGVARVIDYPWIEIDGQSMPPAYNEKTLGLAQPSTAHQVGVDPTTSRMTGPSRMKESETRADVGVSLSRQSEPEAQVRPQLYRIKPWQFPGRLVHLSPLSKGYGASSTKQ